MASHVQVYHKNFSNRKDKQHQVSFGKYGGWNNTNRYFTSLSRAKAYAIKKVKEYGIKTYTYKDANAKYHITKVR